MRKMGFAVTLLSSLAATAATAVAEEQCQLLQLASLDMSFDSAGGVAIPVRINDHPETLLVDTGGIVSMLTKSTVRSLDLQPRSLRAAFIHMYGGQAITQAVTIDTLQLGRMKAQNAKLLIFPDNGVPPELAGTLAPDILQSYDVDFDFANAKFNLIAKDHCEGRVVYWTKEPYAEIAMKVDLYGHISIKLQIDGKDVEAAIDTGSSRSRMSLETAEQLFGFDKKSADLKLLEGSSDAWHGYHYPFKALTLPGMTVNHPDIILDPDREAKAFEIGSPQLILGMGILRQLHLYIAYNEKKLYVTAATAH